MAPELASVKGPDGAWREVKTADIALGTIILARPGEKLALDGRVTSGFWTIDQAPVTGESLPAETAGKPEPSLKRLFAASAIAVVAELASIAVALPVWATAAMALIAVLLGGFSTWLSGWRSIRRRKLD
ncbi:MAG: hypothetical protein LBU12_08950, partial [Deltaproteobacteria bacterium]|nr:hypothetical protein [Deltaproteobacteria bacterium]